MKHNCKHFIGLTRQSFCSFEVVEQQNSEHKRSQSIFPWDREKLQILSSEEDCHGWSETLHS